jgi:hypothetical protein
MSDSENIRSHILLVLSGKPNMEQMRDLENLILASEENWQQFGQLVDEIYENASDDLKNIFELEENRKLIRENIGEGQEIKSVRLTRRLRTNKSRF